MIRKLGKEPVKTKNDYHRPQDAWVEQPWSNDDGKPDGVRRRVRSLRSRRTMFTLAVTAFTVGALIIIGTSPYKNDFLVPGPLCSSHAQILAGQGADRCAACHGASNHTVASWLTDTLTGGRTIAASQSDLCMKCHEQSISPKFSVNPHSVAVSELKKRTDKFQPASCASSRPVVQALSSPPLGSHSEIACSACHREHHGLSSLTAVTDQQCQSCHLQVFESFENGHPEFTNWPQQRRSRIAFDHLTHAGKHFPGKATEFNCNQCHVDGPYGNVKTLAPFEQSCAACHDQQIQQSGESGFAIFALPSIDPAAMEAQNLKIGSWPLAATGDFDGRIPPAMRLLLQADPAAQGVLNRMSQKFGSEIDFADLNAEEASDVADAAELVWAIKRLMYDLATSGREALGQRLSQTLGTDVSLEQVSTLASELDESVFQNTVRRWLPDLEKEVAQRAASQVSQLTPWENETLSVSSSRTLIVPVKFSKAASLDEEVLADNPLKDLLSAVEAASETKPSTSLATAGSKSSDDAADVFGDSARSEAKQATASAGSEDPQKNLTLRDPSTSGVPTDSDLLAINPLTELGSREEGGSLSLTNPNMPAFDAAGATKSDGPTAGKQSEAATWNPPAVTRAGWYRDDELFRVFYRPGGHEDGCIKAWSDLAASITEANSRSEVKPLFKQLLSDKGIGLCATCHTVDQLSDNSFNVNWVAEYRDPSVGAFTKFSHQPHTLQPHLRDCSGCHDMSQPVSNTDSFTSFDANEMVSNFAPITKLNCVNCHREGSTDNSCTHCHSYHVGTPVEPNQN